MPTFSPLLWKEQVVALVLLLAFISVPIIEIALFIEIGERIGLWSTLGVVILTAVLGTVLLRHQGFEVLRRVQTQLNSRQMPLQEMFDGLCLLLAGAVLLTPGFFTDAIGFLLMVPGLRRVAASYLLRQIAKRGHINIHGTTQNANAGPSQGSGTHYSYRSGRGFDDGVIDGDFEDITGKPDPESASNQANKLPSSEEHDSSSAPDEVSQKPSAPNT